MNQSIEISNSIVFIQHFGGSVSYRHLYIFYLFSYIMQAFNNNIACNDICYKIHPSMIYLIKQNENIRKTSCINDNWSTWLRLTNFWRQLNIGLFYMYMPASSYYISARQPARIMQNISIIIKINFKNLKFKEN